MRRLLMLLLAVFTVASVAACSSTTSTGTWEQTTANRTVIDVRTPAEYAEGHVEGAVNLDVTAPDAAAQIAALDPAQDYVVYCRSGNRSAAAASQMKAEGLDVIDAGGLSDVESAGAPMTS